MRGFVAAVAVTIAAATGTAPAATSQPAPGTISYGRQLYLEGCASCHGITATGQAGSGPSLIGVGAAAADFYLSTGRMPLDSPGDEPARKPPAYGRAELTALITYVGSLGGPPIPGVDTAHADLAAGFEAFTISCAGCHQVLGRGGVVTGGVAPSLPSATPTQIAEAIRIGPYLMPRFSVRQLDAAGVADIAAYIRYTRAPDDRGGLGIGHLGPIPEGMVAWLVAMTALLVVARLLGRRVPS